MDTNDKELFESAIEDQVTEVAADEPAAEVTEEAGQPRDEHGRFAPKEPEPVAEAKPESQPAEQPAKEEAHVPSWRLREMREEREAEARRFADREAQWQRQLAELQARLPKEAPPPVPDVFENPNAFLEHGVKQAVDPVRSEVQQTREFFSRMMAEDKHGADKVKAAYSALDNAAKAGDPDAIAVVARVKQSMHPYGDMVAWHQKQSVFQQIGNDPNAWFEKQLEERMKDPAFQAQILGKTQQTVRSSASTPSIVRPPSLTRVAGTAGNEAADNDMSDAGLFAHAMR